MKQRHTKFEVVLVEAVQEGLNIISPAVSEVVLIHLQKQAPMRINKHVIDPEAFDNGLQKMFGCGAKVIEMKILERLYLKLEAPSIIKCDFKFAEEVKKAQKLLGSNSARSSKTMSSLKSRG